MIKTRTDEEGREKSRPASSKVLTLKASKRTLAFNRGMNAAARRQVARQAMFIPMNRHSR